MGMEPQVGMEKPILFTNLPLCKDLCHILVSIDPNEKKDKSVKSDFQWQLLKTRLLLFSEKNVIATPASGMLQYIHVVARKEYLRDGCLTSMLQKLRLKVESVGILSLAVYEECLIYNLIAKLAPLWNKFEKYFIEGRYFLMQRGALHAIELNVIIKGDMLMLYASPLKIWLREVSLFDLLPSSNLEETICRPFFIDLYTQPQWVHVLPSFKRGHLVYVTNRIPKQSGFEDYLQMRRHWKNTYGYRLPEDDSSTIYVGISFFNSNDFLYPLECVRRGMHMNKDEFSIVVNFAKAVAVKAGFVCGNHLKLLNLAELQNTPNVRISKNFKWSESTLAELDSDLLNKWLCKNNDFENLTVQSQDISLCIQSPSEMTFPLVKDDPIKNEDHENWLINCSQFIDGLIKGGQKRSYLKACRPSFNQIDTPTSSDKQDPTPQPPFNENPLPGVTCIYETSITMEGETNQIQPTLFKPCSSNSVVVESNFDAENKSEHVVDPCRSEVAINQYNTTSLENKNAHGNETSVLSNVISHVGPYKPVFKKKRQLYCPRGMIEAVDERKRKGRQISNSNLNSAYPQQSINEKNNNNAKCCKKMKETKTAEVNEKIAKDLKDISEITNKLANEDVLKNTVSSQISISNQVSMEFQNRLSNFSLDTLVSPVSCTDMKLEFAPKNITKRKSDKAAMTPKERKKSVVLNANEIENLVLLDQVGKANVLSLCSYLKGKGVSFSKDKKDALIEKVKHVVMIGIDQ